MSTDINNPYPFEGIEQSGNDVFARRDSLEQKAGKLGLVTRLASTQENDLTRRTQRLTSPNRTSWAGLIVVTSSILAGSIALANNRESELDNEQDHITPVVTPIEVQHVSDVGQPVQVDVAQVKP